MPKKKSRQMEEPRSRKEHTILASQTIKCQRIRNENMEKVAEEHLVRLRSGSVFDIMANSSVLFFSSPW